jgi:hypothetical protein
MSENLDLNINIQTKGTEVIGILRKEIKEANGELLKAQTLYGDYSKEAINAANKVAILRDKIQEAKETSDLFDPGKKFQALSGTLSTLAGGFGAVQGAMALFGAESDNVQKALLKVQSAMALSQGLSVIKDGAKDFERLGTIIKSTSVYQAAYNFIMGTTVAVTEAATVTTVEQTVALEAEAVATTQVAVATTAATVSLRLFRAALLATGIGAAVILIGTLVTYLTDLAGATEKARKEKERLDKAYVDGSKKSYTQYLEDFDSLKEAELAKAGENEDAKFKIEEEYRKKKIAALEQQSKELLGKDVEAEGEIQKQIAKLKNEGLINSYAEQRRLKKLLDERKIQEAVDAALVEKQAIDNALSEYEKRQEKRKKINVETIGQDGMTDSERKKKEEDDEKAKADKEKRTREFNEKSEKDGLGKTLAIKAKADLDAINQAEDTAAAKKRIDELEKQSKIESAYAIADITAGISNIIGQETAAGKAIAIASATIDTYLSASTIFKQASKNPITVVNPAYPYLMAAPAVLGGIARVKQIASVSIPRGGGGGGSMPSMSSAAPIPPQLPTAQVTQLNQQTINDIGNQAVRAYVVESDVTSSQERITAIRQRARFS